MIAGRYEVITTAGKGGMGIVYACHDRRLDRQVAVKQMSADVRDNPAFREQFTLEARAAARLRHKNIVVIYEIDETDGELAIVMELLKGTTLAEVAKPLDLESTLRLMTQACDGLAHAHERDTIHRDIKPLNLFRCDDGMLKILDFGTARIGNSAATTTGVRVFTPDYCAPEQPNWDRTGKPADMFSLGVVMYELLAGARPFVAADQKELLRQIVREPHKSLHACALDVPRAVSELVDRLLAKRPDDRPTARQAHEALLALTPGRTMSVTREAAPAPGRGVTWRRLPVTEGAAAAVVLSVLVGLGLMKASGWPSERAASRETVRTPPAAQPVTQMPAPADMSASAASTGNAGSTEDVVKAPPGHPDSRRGESPPSPLGKSASAPADSARKDSKDVSRGSPADAHAAETPPVLVAEKPREAPPPPLIGQAPTQPSEAHQPVAEPLAPPPPSASSPASSPTSSSSSSVAASPPLPLLFPLWHWKDGKRGRLSVSKGQVVFTELENGTHSFTASCEQIRNVQLKGTDSTERLRLLMELSGGKYELGNSDAPQTADEAVNAVLDIACPSHR